jgi:hypothetical protein
VILVVSEDHDADRNTDSEGCAPEVSDGNEYMFVNWNRDHSCYILSSKLFMFFSSSETLCQLN